MQKSIKIIGLLFVSIIIYSLIVLPSHAGTNKININTASVEELKQLKGIGETLANRIIEYREKNGHFKKTNDIKKVKGIGLTTYWRISSKITVGEHGDE